MFKVNLKCVLTSFRVSVNQTCSTGATFCLLELPIGVRGSVIYCGEFTNLLIFPFPATFL